MGQARLFILRTTNLKAQALIEASQLTLGREVDGGLEVNDALQHQRMTEALSSGLSPDQNPPNHRFRSKLTWWKDTGIADQLFASPAQEVEGLGIKAIGVRAADPLFGDKHLLPQHHAIVEEPQAQLLKTTPLIADCLFLHLGSLRFAN